MRSQGGVREMVSDLPKLHLLVSIAGAGLFLFLLYGIGRSEQIPRR